jgi:hypothetical protein
MKAELWNLCLFALAIGKAAGMTLLGPAILFVYAAEKWASANRIPARKVLGKVVSDGKEENRGEEDGLTNIPTRFPSYTAAHHQADFLKIGMEGDVQSINVVKYPKKRSSAS